MNRLFVCNSLLYIRSFFLTSVINDFLYILDYRFPKLSNILHKYFVGNIFFAFILKLNLNILDLVILYIIWLIYYLHIIRILILNKLNVFRQSIL